MQDPVNPVRGTLQRGAVTDVAAVDLDSGTFEPLGVVCRVNKRSRPLAE
jgi:hypothetical protein